MSNYILDSTSCSFQFEVEKSTLASKMDPNPTNFPILSYVMSKVPSFKRAVGISTDEYDVEKQQSSSLEPHFDLTEKMPHLKNPKIIAAMRLAVANVAQSRSVLKTLGERPDHESVDNAKAKVAEIEAKLSEQLDEIILSPKEEVCDGKRSMEREREREKKMYKAVISLDEMHETYENMLRQAEDRLQKIYEVAVVGSDIVEMEEEKVEVIEEVNEEVVAILKEAEANHGIQRVDLSERRLSLLPEAFGNIKSLLVLDLSNNQLKVIPDSIAGLENLEELNLSTNLLETLPDSLGLLFKLKILDVSRNELIALPDSICHCRSLVELNAGFNKLTYLPTNIGYELKNLRKLWVPLNKIRNIPTSIGEIKRLQHLDVHFNELRGIPPSVGKLTNLEILDLSGNFSDLSELPSTIGDLTNLKELNLSNNQIHELPDTFGRLENLIKLNVYQNPLVIPPKEIVDQGVEVIKRYMLKRRLNIHLEEDRMGMLEIDDEANGSLLTRSTSWLSNVAASVSVTVSAYLGPVGALGNSNADTYLNQQR
ncbi:hypothetical protein M9H77_08061 [Catharanthus roseus]|uniref:Uncharacterized protein n=1 Tax=Catharanthus roseus TaxID=4058 RepID=A0ACC0BX11_CATRO|nr:hypothetical protein M9H77_08061 [Catharanthus roseus]